MFISIHPENPQERNIKRVVECLQGGGVIIYPTDTIYGVGCDIHQTKAIERVAQIKNIAVKNANFSFICDGLSNLSNYAANIDTPTFRLFKKYTPGAFTFILNASKMVPKLLKTKKETVGIRIPEHVICQSLIAAIGSPIISSSLPQDDDVEYFTDPYIIHEIFEHQVDMVIDGGIGGIIGSTIIDLTTGTPTLIRQGLGEWEE